MPSRLGLLGVSGPVGSPAPTYATWNPSDKDSGITLSNGNLSAQGVSGTVQYKGARSTIGKSSGKWYWEYSFSGTDVLNGGFGVGSATALLNLGGGMDTGEGYRVYYDSGNKYVPGAAYGAAFDKTNILSVLLDMDAGNLVMYRNNVSQGTLVSGLSGTFFAYFGMHDARNNILTANFGASAFAYSVPGGYNPGLYT